jgi:hypothetical protein
MTSKWLTALFFSAIVVVFFSCTKTETGDITSYIRVKKNSVWTYFKATGQIEPDFFDSTRTNLGISSFNPDTTEVFSISIQVDSTIFPLGGYVSGQISPYVIIDYTTGLKSNPVNYEISDAPGRAPSQYTVVVTSITDNFIDGTFYGNYLFDSFGGVYTYEIPEGEFHVRRTK